MNQEIQKGLISLVSELEVLCKAYGDSHVWFINENVVMPKMSRLFEIVEKLERLRLDEIRRFQVTTGCQDTQLDSLKTLPIFGRNPIEVLKTINEQEKKILQLVSDLCRSCVDKKQMEVLAFLNQRILLRLQKVVFRREQQINNLKVSNNTTIVDMLFIDWDIKRLETTLIFEIERRMWHTEASGSDSGFNMLPSHIPERLIGQNLRF